MAEQQPDAASSITSRAQSPTKREMILKKPEADEGNDSITSATLQTIKTDGSSLTSEHPESIGQWNEPMPLSKNRQSIDVVHSSLPSGNAAMAQEGPASSLSDFTLNRWSVRKSKLPPPLESSRSMPLIKRIKSILGPKRAPTAPLPTNDLPKSTDPRGLALDTSMPQPSLGPEPEPPQSFDFELPDPPNLEKKTITEDTTDPPDETTTTISHPPDGTASPGTQASLKISTATAFDIVPFTNLEEQRGPEGVKQLEDGLDFEGEILNEFGSEARFSEDEIRDLEALMSPSPDAEAVQRLQATIRNSVDSVSSYASTLSSLSVSSRSSMEADEEIADITTLQFDSPGEVDTGSHPTILQPPRIMELLPDSPTDPLFQQGRLSPIPPSTHRRTPSTSTEASHRASTRPEVLQGQQEMLKLPPCNGSGKGTCKSCSSAILSGQKSVTSADGRLTGRYHKHCFACTRCQSRFATAEFYVFNDQPYCHQHYHELSETICAGCGNGIEGQYMETSLRASSQDAVGKQKFHLECLTCTTCHTMLKEEYFEFNGRVYCEKDAFRLANVSTKAAHEPTRSSPLIRELVAGSIDPVVVDPDEQVTEGLKNSVVDPEPLLALEPEPVDDGTSTDQTRHEAVRVDE